MRIIPAIAALVVLVTIPVAGEAQESRERNLQICLTGKYPTLCRYDLLSTSEQLQAREAERRENLQLCLTGKYPSLCNHSHLTPDQAAAVRAAERAENFNVCITGKYPALCRHDLLAPTERAEVRSAEERENLKICLDGRYPTLCHRSLLTPEQVRQVTAAEAGAPSPTPQTKTLRPSSGTCFESTIMSPRPFMGNNGEVFKLADGSLWEVKYEYEYLYEYFPEVVVCPARGTLIVAGKTLDIQHLSQPNTRQAGGDVPASGEVIESRIDGEFTGWDGETIFKLRNGQIWQQVSYAYKYKYAYSPEVLIYKSGSVYKMRVDGVDGEITVRRLR